MKLWSYIIWCITFIFIWFNTQSIGKSYFVQCILLQIRGSIPLLWEQIVDLSYKPQLRIINHEQMVYFKFMTKLLYICCCCSWGSSLLLLLFLFFVVVILILIIITTSSYIIFIIIVVGREFLSISWILLLYLIIYSWICHLLTVRSCGTPFSWSLTTIWKDNSSRPNWQSKVLFSSHFHFRPDLYYLCMF